MLPIHLDDSSPGKGLRPMDLIPAAEDPSWESGQARPSEEGVLSQALWPLGHCSIPSGMPGCCLPLCLSARLSGCGAAASPEFLGVAAFFRHQSHFPASHGSFSGCHRNYGLKHWRWSPGTRQSFQHLAPLGPLCKLSLSPGVQREAKGFWEPWGALTLGKDSTPRRPICASHKPVFVHRENYARWSSHLEQCATPECVNVCRMYGCQE